MRRGICVVNGDRRCGAETIGPQHWSFIAPSRLLMFTESRMKRDVERRTGKETDGRTDADDGCEVYLARRNSLRLPSCVSAIALAGCRFVHFTGALCAFLACNSDVLHFLRFQRNVLY